MSRDSNYHSGRKDNCCYFCDCGPPLEEHHVIPQRFGGPDTKKNIVELCQLCHQRLERLYDKSFYQWFGIEDEQGQRKFHRQCETEDCTNKAKVELGNTVELLSKYMEGMFIARNRDDIFKSGLYCKPCAAQNAVKTHQFWKERYRQQRSRLHDEARSAYVTPGASLSTIRAIDIDKPKSAEWLYEFTLVDEADD